MSNEQPTFEDWWSKDHNKRKAESIHGVEAERLANKIDPECIVPNLYMDKIEELAKDSRMHLISTK